MVSEATITTMCTILAGTILGILTGLLFMVKKFKEKGIAVSFFFGAIGFFIPQLAIRLPILSQISSKKGFEAFYSNHYVIYSFLLALSTGFFEMIGRWIVLKYFMKSRITYHKAFSAGYGHGGVEAMLVLGYSLFNNIMAAVLINNGLIEDAMKDTGAAQSDIDILVNTLVNTKAINYYLDAAERILFLFIQIMLTILLGYFIMKGKEVYGMLVITIIHTMVNFLLAIVNGMSDKLIGKGISQITAYIIILFYLGAVNFVFYKYIERIKPYMYENAVANGFVRPEEKKHFPKLSK